MNEVPADSQQQRVLLVYYSQGARSRLETSLSALGIEVQPIDGRAPYAITELTMQLAALIVVDSSPKDLISTQAVRQIGHILPQSRVLAVNAAGEAAAYLGGHRTGQMCPLEEALSFTLKAR